MHGKQYWMQEDLRTQYYRDGTALTQQTKLGEGAGYFCPEESDAYQYNGEAVLAGELTPSGWKIPIMEDWETLNEYIGGEASLFSGKKSKMDPSCRKRQPVRQGCLSPGKDT